MHEIDITAALKLCVELPVIKERLHRIGLHKTGCGAGDRLRGGWLYRA